MALVTLWMLVRVVVCLIISHIHTLRPTHGMWRTIKMRWCLILLSLPTIRNLIIVLWLKSILLLFHYVLGTLLYRLSILKHIGHRLVICASSHQIKFWAISFVLTHRLLVLPLANLILTWARTDAYLAMFRFHILLSMADHFILVMIHGLFNRWNGLIEIYDPSNINDIGRCV